MRKLESGIQKGLIQWAKVTKIKGFLIADYLFAIPNGGTRNVREAVNLKAQGVKSGVSDLFLALPTSTHSGLWIELKSPKGKLSESQKEWLDRMDTCGYSTSVCYSVDMAIDAIKAYVNENN